MTDKQNKESMRDLVLAFYGHQLYHLLVGLYEGEEICSDSAIERTEKLINRIEEAIENSTERNMP